MLLWKPSWEGTDAPSATRPWDIWRPNIQTGKGEREPAGPVQQGAIFVLDGQQRLTSLLRVLFRSLAKDKTSFDPDLLIALSSDDEWKKDPFQIRSRALQRKMKDGLLIDAQVLFEGVRGGDENGAVIEAIRQWVTPSDPSFPKALNRANEIRNAIFENEIVAYEIDADAYDENNDVIEIFARLNQQGITLRPSELATARLTGALANFREKARTAMVHKDFLGFVGSEGQEDRIRTGGFVDTDLLIRAAMFIATDSVRYRDLQQKGRVKI